ncbi:hypothetical protein HMPREF2758_06870 [Facklamia sp. HMSC062C11]|uniref:hypothetical protein n=1 Tax=Facklamia sp. HMSC062C11 TaxID=1739262 RepID=UPI0008A2DDFA|nr:hypothetical protein [Facklamia sp. HMSC062C11]OFL66859.1 hypothetical protein HMPREF2758_06870 [Facklamia sp. HMSC062C11]
MNIKKIFVYLYAFLLIYLPDFSYLGSLLKLFKPSILLFLLAMINIILLNRRLYFFIKKARVGYLFLCILLATVTTVLRNMSNTFYFPDLVSPILLIPLLVNYIALIIWNEKYYKNLDLSDLLIKIGLIQTFIMVLMYIFPPFKQIANNLYLSAGELRMDLVGITNTRIYGLASNYTTTLPFVQALLGLIALKKFHDSKSYRYWFISLILASGSLLNNRTGFIVYAFVSILYYLYLLFFERISKSRRLYDTFLFLWLSIVLMFFFNTERGIWLIQILKEIKDFYIHGQDSQYMLALSNQFIRFPDGVDLLIGTGHRAYGEFSIIFHGFHSDIGYINDLFRGGIVYVVLLYGSVIYTILHKVSSKLWGVLFIIFLFLINYKAEVINGSAVMMILLAEAIFEQYKSMIDKECVVHE